MALLANAYGIHSHIQQIVLHVVHVRGTVLGVVSPAQQQIKQNPHYHGIYIEWREIKWKANEYATFLKTKKAGQGRRATEGVGTVFLGGNAVRCLRQGGFRVGTEAAGRSTAAGLPGIPVASDTLPCPVPQAPAPSGALSADAASVARNGGPFPLKA